MLEQYDSNKLRYYKINIIIVLIFILFRLGHVMFIILAEFNDSTSIVKFDCTKVYLEFNIKILQSTNMKYLFFPK